MRSSQMISQDDLRAPAPEIASGKLKREAALTESFIWLVLALSDAFRLTNCLSALYILYLTLDKWRTVDLIQHSFS